LDRLISAVAAVLIGAMVLFAASVPKAVAIGGEPTAQSLTLENFESYSDERIGDKHDTAAQVYVIFDNQILPRIIKYMWSGAVPAGARFTHPLYGRARVVIVRSGAPEPGKWFDEKINLYEDYKQFFSAEPGKVQGIALMSSSDSTNSVAGADYDDFVLSL
jgi:Protein of unknown function (DUF3047)